MKINENFVDNLANLTEDEIWKISRYIADYIEHESKNNKRIDKHTIFWAIDAILGGALD